MVNSSPRQDLSATRPWIDFTGFLWGLWIGLSPVLSFMVTPPRTYVSSYGDVDTRFSSPLLTALLALGVASAIVPVGWTILRRHIQLSLALPVAAILLPILFMMVLSLISDPTSKDVQMVAMAIYVFSALIVLTAQYATTQSISGTMLATVAVIHAVALSVALVDGNFVSGRFQGRIGSNYWGAVAAYTLFASLLVRNWFLKLGIIAVCLIGLYASQNRSSMLAALAGMTVVVTLYTMVVPFRGRLKIAFSTLLGIGGAAFFFPYIYSKLFKLDDSRRGLEAGGTGRTEAWRQAWELIERNPLLGVGYRHHESYITVASSAHNAYLATAADMGLFGLLAYLLFLGSGLAAAIVKALKTGQWVYIAFAGVITGYMFQGVLEQRAINLANSVSLLVMCCVVLAVRREPHIPSRQHVISDGGREFVAVTD